jgi:hypothetical protein
MGTVAVLADVADRLTNELNGLDAGSWSAREAEAVLAASVRVANAANHAAAVAARQVGRTNAHRGSGDRTEAHYLARVAGVGVGAAKTALATLERLDSLDATRRSVCRGELSGRQAAAITEAAIVDPSAEARLLAMARARGVGQLEDECARVRAAAAPDDEAERHRRARRERGAWKHLNRDGSAEIRFRSSVEDVAEAWAVIAAYRDRIFRDSSPGDGVSFDNRSADGFMEMAKAAAGGVGTTMVEPTLPLDGVDPPRPVPRAAKVIVRVDLDALLRGYPMGGETCEIAGYGPVPTQAVRDMIATGDAFLAAVATTGVDVINVAHLGRKPTAHQRSALEWSDPRCRAQGCDRTVGLEIDHRVDWADTKLTLLGWLDWLCTHHQLKTSQGWQLVDGTGIRPMVAPDDPPPPPSRTNRTGAMTTSGNLGRSATST